MKHEAKRTRDWIKSPEFDEACTHLFTRIQRARGSTWPMPPTLEFVPGARAQEGAELMIRGPHTFKQSDLARAIRAAPKTGAGKV